MVILSGLLGKLHIHLEPSVGMVAIVRLIEVLIDRGILNTDIE
tara:strand:- start:309 stop:437 length:129 start_codon:yes stop_codon:yes gene_type:complete